jgi:hypothetical protein
MKKYLLGLAMLASFLPASLLAYQNQGFESWSEQGGINFSCKTQCLIDLGMKGTNNLFQISGVEWNGTIIVGNISNGQLIPIASSPVKNGRAKLFVDSYGGQDLPEQLPLVMIIDGNMTATNGSISSMKANGIDKIKIGWNSFWTNEGQTFYGINLRYGAKRGDTSVVVIWYWIFFLGLIVLYFRNKLNMKNTLYLGVSLFLIIAIRNQIDYSNTTLDNLKSYTFAEEWKKTYGNLGDFYEFITQSREAIGIKKGNKECRVYYQCAQERPFCVHMWLVFMKPCEKTEDPSQSDYQIYYKKTPTQVLGTKILEFNNSFVYKTK